MRIEKGNLVRMVHLNVFRPRKGGLHICGVRPAGECHSPVLLRNSFPTITARVGLCLPARAYSNSTGPNFPTLTGPFVGSDATIHRNAYGMQDTATPQRGTKSKPKAHVSRVLHLASIVRTCTEEVLGSTTAEPLLDKLIYWDGLIRQLYPCTNVIRCIDLDLVTSLSHVDIITGENALLRKGI